MANTKEQFLIFLRGIFMGVADIIPGVSGGTIAFITGIYERLIAGVSSINSLFVKELFNRKPKKAFYNLKKFDFEFFIPLLLGIFLSFMTLSHLMSYLLLEFTALTYAFFFGLILASALLVYSHADKNHKNNLLYLAIGLIFALWFVGLQALQANHSAIVLFFSGAIAISAMVLPGISGAFILVLLDQYEFIISAIKGLEMQTILVFGFGALVGILSFSKLLNYLLTKHRAATMAFLTGLMLGSLKVPYIKVVSESYSLVGVLFVGIIGFAFVFLLERKFRK